MTATASARRQTAPSPMRIDEPRVRRGGFSARSYAANAPAVAEPNLGEAADLYYRKFPKGLAYRHFESTERALKFVRDTLSAHQTTSAVLQVGERRYEGAEVAAMVNQLGPRREAN